MNAYVDCYSSTKYGVEKRNRAEKKRQKERKAKKEERKEE